ncbi:Sec-independent protein translocase protein TatB [Aureimonas jatrophae]|jgi:sec-independent protein translocase protein TatB|uniref:Sec-independent protein translocase protein TatB n=1 Tax=Aureimonas jatrophae TaxID=1166073 RepID=A0A1H0MUB9_9HYPH|nr:Sec-independent protein translocase protein TatB [Aureimonas jatrophae]MBB3951221.1 sec-independent protein translocase protein TatB [Aureimonas jatrophae]SDO83886.1 sec-independent protein translocase protein TatB [Aureimonas jatrophae]
MFDIGGLELLVIAVVMIVVVGPKDLPRMLRTFGRVTGQMRRMAGDFRRQFDDALREAEMDELRNTVNDVKSLDPREDIRKAMNPIRAVGDEIRSSLKAATVAPEPTVARPDAAAAPMPSPEPADAADSKPIHMNGSGHPLPAETPQGGGSRSNT